MKKKEAEESFNNPFAALLKDYGKNSKTICTSFVKVLCDKLLIFFCECFRTRELDKTHKSED